MLNGEIPIPSLDMSGIFFDEIPTHYTPEYVSYLQAISQAVHSHRGLREGHVGERATFISTLGVSLGFYQSPKSVGPDIWAPSLYQPPFFQNIVFWKPMDSQALDFGSCKNQG